MVSISVVLVVARSTCLASSCLAWVRSQEVTIDTFCGCPAQQLTVVCAVTSFFSYVSRRSRTKLLSTANLKRMLFASGVKGSNVKDATVLFHVFCTRRSVSDEHPATYQEHTQVFRLDVDGEFVWLVAHVHELIHHRALLSRITCGCLRFCAGLFSLFLLQGILATTSSCSCFGRHFTVRSSTFPFDVIHSFL